MRVGLDVSPLAQTRAGTARYVQALLDHLPREPGIELHELSGGGGGRVSTLLLDAAWYPAVLPLTAHRTGLDVLHCPTFRAPPRPGVPLVVTVHDLAVLRHPEAFPRWTRTYSRLTVPRIVRAAARVIAVSEFTRRELTGLLDVPEEKIRVVPNAASPLFAPDGPAADGEYLLAVGTLEPRKNLPRVAEAARHLGLELRVVGGEGWGGVRAAGNGVRPLGFVPDEELATLYRGARAVLYPSLYEGFGIPVLEAMACGAPVVTSAGTATEEVAGGAAVLVDPADPASIAAGIEEALDRRDELVRSGLRRAGEFSWARSAAATAEVYREAAA
jgi:glycosyltransferase involved in cell wall biosynthesis